MSRNRSEGVVAVTLLPTDERYVEISLREGREMRLKRSSCREDSQAARRYGGARHTLIALRTPPALAGARCEAALPEENSEETEVDIGRTPNRACATRGSRKGVKSNRVPTQVA